MMRTIRANNRAARRKRAGMQALRDAVGKRTPFCYVEYKGIADENFWHELHYQHLLYGRAAIDEAVARLNSVSKRVFPSYAKAMAHLTALKLNACKEDDEYKSFKPCNIVQGYYTVSGKVVIEQTQDISDERISVGRDNSSQRQSSDQRGYHVPISQNMARTDHLHQAKRAAARARRISGTASGGIRTTAMDVYRNAIQIISDWDRSTTLSSI